jgi:hypothetical protein
MGKVIWSHAKIAHLRTRVRDGATLDALIADPLFAGSTRRGIKNVMGRLKLGVGDQRNGNLSTMNKLKPDKTAQHVEPRDGGKFAPWAEFDSTNDDGKYVSHMTAPNPTEPDPGQCEPQSAAALRLELIVSPSDVLALKEAAVTRGCSASELASRIISSSRATRFSTPCSTTPLDLAVCAPI